MLNKLLIYTDGSSLGNPGHGGYGIVIKCGKKNIELNGGEADTTNNRMEMLGVIKALEWVNKNNKQNYKIELFSDSALVINSLNLNWKRKKNLDLWKKLDLEKTNLNIIFTWIKGHNEHPENERCDVLAKQAAFKIPKIFVKKSKRITQTGMGF